MWKVNLSDGMGMNTDLYMYVYSFVYICVLSAKLTLYVCVAMIVYAVHGSRC